jgi:hypothetical protein
LLELLRDTEQRGLIIEMTTFESEVSSTDAVCESCGALAFKA